MRTIAVTSEPGWDITMMEMTIQVPDALGHLLQRYQDRLPELLERGLREAAAENETLPPFQDESAVRAVLASQPSPEQVLALHPSPELQTRVTSMLDRRADGALLPHEEAELERYLIVEHLVRLAKAYADRQCVRPG